MEDGTFEDDIYRRDFTINAIYCDKFGKIFDPVNGIKDLKNKNLEGLTQKIGCDKIEFKIW